MFMRTSQTHHYEFDGQTADIGTNRFELNICDFLGTNKHEKKKNRNEQQLKNTKKIRKTTVGLEQVQIIDGKEVTWFTTLNMRNTVQNKMGTIKKAI